MKKIISIILTVIIMCTLASCGCSNSASGGQAGSLNQTPDKEISQVDTLVVYFSMPEKTNVNNVNKEEDKSKFVIDGKEVGGTQYVAHLIKDATGSDIFRIVPQTAYPTDHRSLTGQTKKEQTDKARPAIADKLTNMDQYSTVYVGFPVWWDDMPMIMYTFFDQYDLSGKTIIPFCVEDGSGPCGTVNTIKELEPGANVNENILSVSKNTASECKPQVMSWLEELGVAPKSE